MFITSIVFFISFTIAKYKMHKKAKDFGGYSDGWNDGYPPDHIPRSWITQGMKLDPNDGKNVISTWKFNGRYYSWLASE